VPFSDDGSMTSGVTKNVEALGSAADRLIEGLPGRKRDSTAHPIRRAQVIDSATRSGICHILPLGASIRWVSPMNDVTRILSSIELGDPHAAEQLLPLVYDELRQLAAHKLVQEKPPRPQAVQCAGFPARRDAGGQGH
jgi:hypothetical protein